MTHPGHPASFTIRHFEGVGGGLAFSFFPRAWFLLFSLPLLSKTHCRQFFRVIFMWPLYIFFLFPFVEATSSHYFSNNAKVKATNMPSSLGKGKIAMDSSDKMWPLPPVRRPHCAPAGSPLLGSGLLKGRVWEFSSLNSKCQPMPVTYRYIGWGAGKECCFRFFHRFCGYACAPIKLKIL